MRNLAGPCLLLLLSSACAQVGRYGTARTLPPGRLAHSLGVELAGSPDNLAPDPHVSMRYGVRGGLTEGVEFGGEVSVTHVGLDTKFELLRRRSLDLAVDPGIAAGRYLAEPDSVATSFILATAELPIVADLNLTRWLSLVPHVSAGATYRRDALGGDSMLDRDALPLNRIYPTLGAGIGMDIRPHRLVALHPMVAAQWQFDRAQPELRGAGNTQRWLTFGIALRAGAQPDFD